MTIPKDKLLHFVAGSICSAVVYLISGNLTLAIGASVALGISKEVYDSRGHGTVEVADAVRAYVQSCFNHEAELLPLIEAATTQAELDAIEW